MRSSVCCISATRARWPTVCCALASGHRFAPDRDRREADAAVHDHMRHTLRGRARREDLAPLSLRASFDKVADRYRDRH